MSKLELEVLKGVEKDKEKDKKENYLLQFAETFAQVLFIINRLVYFPV